MLAQAYFFGTFNPIHMGHLSMAQAALQIPGIKRVVFIPSPQPPHRLEDADMAPAHDRWAMVRLATACNPAFSVDAIELARTGPSFTVDTLALLHPVQPPEKPQEPPHHIPLIIGQDALARLGSWKAAETLLQRCTFLQAPRPGCEPVTHITLNHQPVALPSTRLLSLPPNALSATWVRRQISENHSVHYSVPESVRLYIAWNNLYQ